jgi:hypothetical protein
MARRSAEPEQEKRTTARIEEEVRVDHAKQLAEDKRGGARPSTVSPCGSRRMVHANGPPVPLGATRNALQVGRSSMLPDAYAYAVLREWVVEADGRFVAWPCPPFVTGGTEGGGQGTRVVPPSLSRDSEFGFTPKLLRTQLTA